MCVMAVVIDKRPTPEMVAEMWSANAHGGGVAWREGEGANKVVRWEKDLSLPEIQEYVATLPVPFIPHFRIASCGGQKPELTHPFAVDEFEKSLDLEGTTKGTVLFHNGHWNSWKRELLDMSSKYRKKIPGGRWTDTRAMAFLTSFIGDGYPEILDEGRTVLFGPDVLETSGGWVKVNDIWCSNDIFTKKTTSYSSHFSSSYSICRAARCVTKINLDSEGYCAEHSKTKTIPIVTGTVATTTEIGGSQPVTPFAIRARLAEMEAEWSAMKAGKLKRTDLKFSKNELKRYRAAVAEIPVSPITTSIAH